MEDFPYKNETLFLLAKVFMVFFVIQYDITYTIYVNVYDKGDKQLHVQLMNQKPNGICICSATPAQFHNQIKPYRLKKFCFFFLSTILKHFFNTQIRANQVSSQAVPLHYYIPLCEATEQSIVKMTSVLSKRCQDCDITAQMQKAQRQSLSSCSQCKLKVLLTVQV